jgi:hypothetical protein
MCRFYSLRQNVFFIVGHAYKNARSCEKFLTSYAVTRGGAPHAAAASAGSQAVLEGRDWHHRVGRTWTITDIEQPAEGVAQCGVAELVELSGRKSLNVNGPDVRNVAHRFSFQMHQ